MTFMNLTATFSAFVCFLLFCFIFLRYVYKRGYVTVQTSLREELHVSDLTDKPVSLSLPLTSSPIIFQLRKIYVHL